MSSSYITGNKVKLLKPKLDLHGEAILDGSSITASTVVIADASKNILSSSTPTGKLVLINNLTSDVQTQLDGKLALSGGTITGSLAITGNETISGELRLQAISGYFGLDASNSMTGNTLYIAPSSYPVVSGQALVATSAGAMSWTTIVTSSIGDISPATASIDNSITAVTNISGLLFDGSTVRAGKVFYTVYRTSSTTELAEEGDLDLVYKTTASAWTLAQNYSGDNSGVTFSVAGAITGQVQYLSSTVGGTGYTGKISFRAQGLTV